MKDFFRHNGVWLLVIALLLSILIGLTSAFMGGNADPLSNLVNTVTAPVRSGIAAAADWAEGVYSYVFHYGEIQQQMEELEQEERGTCAKRSARAKLPLRKTSSFGSS